MRFNDKVDKVCTEGEPFLFHVQMIITADGRMDDDPRTNPSSSSSSSIWGHRRCLLASAIMGMGSAAIGTALALTAIVIPDLQLTSSESAAMAGGASAAMFVGALTGGPLIDRYGRRVTAMFAGLPFIIGWTLIAATRHMSVMQVGRILTGLSAGVINVAVPVYLSEVADASIRGLIGSVHELFLNLGLLYTYAFGMAFHWNFLSAVCAVLPASMAVGLFWMPESPRWSVAHGRRDEAFDALLWLRPSSDTGKCAVDVEMSDIEDQNRASSSQSAFHWTEFSQWKLFRPLLIVFGLLFLQGMSGFTALIVFTVPILASATAGTGNRLDAHTQTTIVGVMAVVANAISALVVDRAGRRVMLATSAIGMTLSMSVLAAFFTFKSSFVDAGSVPVVAVTVFLFSVALGYGPVPFYLAGELFPQRARGVAGGLAMAAICLSTFVSSVIFPFLLDALGDRGTYWVFVTICVVAIGFVIVVPETKGRSLEDIEKMFQ